MDIVIKKLGGENAAELSKSSKNIYDDFVLGKFQAVVVSAIRTSEFNTTDKLIELGIQLGQENINREIVFHLIDKIHNFHLDILDKKLICSKNKIVDIINTQFKLFRENITWYINNSSKNIIPTKNNDYIIDNENSEILSILGFGEIISSKIFSSVIDCLFIDGISAKSIDLSKIVDSGEFNYINEKDIFKILSSRLSNIVENNIIGGKIPVLSGYIGFFEDGIENKIGRGYSDATASICTVGLANNGHNVILEIQKSVKGLLTCDPRILENSDDAKLIERVDYLTAREITGDCGAAAKLLHHQTLRDEVQEANVKIHLFDPFSGSDGTWIEKICDNNNNSKALFIGGRENIIFFSISSGKMFENGILSRLFDIVKCYFPVDIISASETEVTFTIDGKNVKQGKIDEMVNKIELEFTLDKDSDMEFISYSKNKALIFCVSNNIKYHKGFLPKATKILSKNDIEIEMLSQGRLARAIVFGIDQKHLKKSVNLLHKEFI